MDNTIGRFEKSEILKFMDVEQAIKVAEASASKLFFKNNQSERPQSMADLSKGESSGVGSPSMPSLSSGGGGGSVSGLIDFIANTSGDMNQSAGQQDKTTLQAEKTVKSTAQGGAVGSTPEGSPDGLFGGDKLYKENKGGYISVQSSNLKAVKYDNDTSQLNVQFLSGSEYTYNGVPNQKYNNLMSWSSHGSYFYWNIRGKGRIPTNPPYAYKKI